jgi:uncharacterized protein
MDSCKGIAIKSSRFGKGLFAVKNLSAGTLVCTISGKELSFSDTLALREKESHAIQIDFEKYFLCEPPFLYSNHSCAPNCAINTSLEFITIRDVRKGEELLWDYSTSMLERHWTMSCACGERNCRKIITDFDLLPQTLQDEYLQRHIVMPFIYEYSAQRLKKTA